MCLSPEKKASILSKKTENSPQFSILGMPMKGFEEIPAACVSISVDLRACVHGLLSDKLLARASGLPPYYALTIHCFG